MTSAPLKIRTSNGDTGDCGLPCIVMDAVKPVAAYDYGARGMLHVDAEPVPKAPVRIRILGKERPDLDVPLDDGAEPKGNGFAGDGLTLYEEYRGFVENGDWKDGDPATKDFFVLNRIGEAAKGGLSLFASASQLQVHHELTEEELDWTRVVNRRSTSARKQHGVVPSLVSGGDDPGYSEAVGGPGPPRMVSANLDSRSNTTNPAAVGSDPGGQPVADADAEIAHELMHACGMRHHGDADDGELQWWNKYKVVTERDKTGQTRTMARGCWLPAARRG